MGLERHGAGSGCSEGSRFLSADPTPFPKLISAACFLAWELGGVLGSGLTPQHQNDSLRGTNSASEGRTDGPTQHRYRKWKEVSPDIFPCPSPGPVCSPKGTAAAWTAKGSCKSSHPLFHSAPGLAQGRARPETGWVSEGCGLLWFLQPVPAPPPPPPSSPCGCSQVSPPNPFPCHSSSGILISGSRREQRGQSPPASFFLLPVIFAFVLQ